MKRTIKYKIQMTRNLVCFEKFERCNLRALPLPVQFLKFLSPIPCTACEARELRKEVCPHSNTDSVFKLGGGGGGETQTLITT